MKTIIHVNQHKIKQNNKNRTQNPVITVKNYKENRYAKKVEILGPATIIYNPTNPLKCGAKCWIETQSNVIIEK
jgi:hypothetical protein